MSAPYVVGMPPGVSNQALMRRLLSASVAAAGSGEFEVAYHALMAALHAAEGIDKEPARANGITEIERVAREQSAQVEKLKPAHQLSRMAAGVRGHKSVYDTLLLHLKSARLRIEADVRRAKTDFRWPDLSRGKMGKPE